MRLWLACAILVPAFVACGDDGGGAFDSSLGDATPVDGAMGDASDASSTDAGDSSPMADASADAAPTDASTLSSGAFRFLTYNVAGLPDAISGSDPAVNTPMMSPLLNAYDIVVVQEDFSYHAELISAATHPYISGPSTAPTGLTFGDGLGRLSMVPFTGEMRERWDECNGIFGSGTDCLAAKGFSVARHQIASGVEVHVYDLHMDAGRGSDDYAAREAQSAQLRAFMAANSPTAAVIVAGDTNMKAEDEPLVLELLAMGPLEDACRTLACPQPELHDRVMYRSGGGIELTPTLWQLDARFVDASGEPLSDHFAVGVDFEWRRTD